MEEYVNTELLPLEVDDFPWLFETRDHSIGDGKWMLFYEKHRMNDRWVLAKKLYRENKLDGVIAMKCSTNYESSRASNGSYEGIIILHCSDSSNEEYILDIGKNILQMFEYKEKQMIYYKTDIQTREGTIATGSKRNHTYKLWNPLYQGRFIDLEKELLQKDYIKWKAGINYMTNKKIKIGGRIHNELKLKFMTWEGFDVE